MITALRSPWFTVSIGIVGLVLGYSLVMAQTPPTTAASAGNTCPHKEACQKGDCDCVAKNCQGDCPGNCGNRDA